MGRPLRNWQLLSKRWCRWGNGSPIYNEEKVYYLLNKPRGVISSVSDEKIVRRWLTSCPTLRNVSILLVVLTGIRLAYLFWLMMVTLPIKWFTHVMRLTRFIWRVSKVLRPRRTFVLWLVEWSLMAKTKPARYNIIKVDHEKNRSVVELTIHEGRNHQVKKMFESVGLLVDKLSRTRFGTLDLTGLRPGESRRLNKKEISQLHNAAVNKVK